MKLNHFTDFGMRVLIYLEHLDENESTSLDELAEKFKISRNHLIKVVQFLSNNNLINTKRGKNGGITIAHKAKTTPIGDLIHLLEQDDSPIIDCLEKTCIFPSQKCQLKQIFNLGYQAFLKVLNNYQLKDLRFENWNQIINQ